jgi:ERCC4-related helicase
MHTLSQTRHSNERDGEIFVLIVHTFFDEYRFISSFKDKKDLISFAKLFGGVINKTILDDTLMNITVYFMIQAL